MAFLRDVAEEFGSQIVSKAVSAAILVLGIVVAYINGDLKSFLASAAVSAACLLTAVARVAYRRWGTIAKAMEYCYYGALMVGLLFFFAFRFQPSLSRDITATMQLSPGPSPVSQTSMAAESESDIKASLSKRAVNGLIFVLPKGTVRVGTLADEQGRLVISIPFISLLDQTVTATVYATVDVKAYIDKPAAERTAEITTEVESLKAATHYKYSQRHAVESVSIVPSFGGDASQESNLEFSSPEKVSEKEWDDINNGREYIYFYVMLAINDDPNKGAPLCGVVDGLQHAPDICPPGSDAW